MVLTDTNILLRALHPAHSHYIPARKALRTLRRRNEVLCVTPQNLIEFWTVATRSHDQNGLGLLLPEAEDELNDIRALFRLLPNRPEILDIWQQLVVEYKVTGKLTHDTHLVAAMRAHSVSQILTFNGEDFKRFPAITVLNPADL